jgi:hypothetical protein
MRCLIAGLFALLMLAPAKAAPQQPTDFASTDAVLRWVNAYRAKPDPKSVPAAMRALSRFGALEDPERCGVYVGFLAGVIGSDPDGAAILIGKTLVMRREDHWVIVRAIAYSGLPDWKQRLRNYASRIPARVAMIDKYIAGKSPTLDQLVVSPGPSGYDQFRQNMRLDAVVGKPQRRVMLEPSPEVLDILWGYYFASGSYGPIMRIVAMLPWSDDRDNVERLTIGSMAKFTLASNATRDQELLAMLKGSSKARNQPEQTVAAINEVTDAAESVEISRIRKQAIAAIDELRRKGSASRRNATWWGFVGQSAIAGGCIAAAVTGHVELGLPCVIGGAAASGAINFMNNQP